jgi:hypothetical protein
MLHVPSPPQHEGLLAASGGTPNGSRIDIEGCGVIALVARR